MKSKLLSLLLLASIGSPFALFSMGLEDDLALENQDYTGDFLVDEMDYQYPDADDSLYFGDEEEDYMPNGDDLEIEIDEED